MEWRDKGILLATKQFGETSLIIDVFTPDHGKASGVVRGGQSKKLKPILQIGAQLDLTWKARLQEHLGSFQVDLIRSRTANVMNDRLLLAGMLSSATLINRFFPAGQVYKNFYKSSENLFDLLQFPDIWLLAYFKWELEFLETLGFGLDLKTCAVTGSTEDLMFISPKTGRAVSQAAARPDDRGRPRSPRRRSFPWLHARVPLLPGGHDHPSGSRAPGRAGQSHDL